MDSAGDTVDFLLSPKRDAHAAKRFIQKALRSSGPARPRVINGDGNPSYPKVIAELKQQGELGHRCRCRPVRYLNNIEEQWITGRSSAAQSRFPIKFPGGGEEPFRGSEIDKHDP